jgi:hypothetical protein
MHQLHQVPPEWHRCKLKVVWDVSGPNKKSEVFGRDDQSPLRRFSRDVIGQGLNFQYQQHHSVSTSTIGY